MACGGDLSFTSIPNPAASGTQHWEEEQCGDPRLWLWVQVGSPP